MFILSSALREGSKVFQSAGAATEKAVSPVALFQVSLRDKCFNCADKCEYQFQSFVYSPRFKETFLSFMTLFYLPFMSACYQWLHRLFLEVRLQREY